MQCTDLSEVVKMENFQQKSTNIFLIFAQNIDCGYMLEPPRRGGSNEYPHSYVLEQRSEKLAYPCITQFCYISGV